MCAVGDFDADFKLIAIYCALKNVFIAELLVFQW